MQIGAQEFWGDYLDAKAKGWSELRIPSVKDKYYCLAYISVTIIYSGMYIRVQ
jgi:hypothetical protein